MPPPLPPIPERLDVVQVLAALADPVRLSLVAQLADAPEMQCGTFEVAVSKSTLAHHFRVLRTAGVVATTRSGTRSLNRLRTEELEAAFPGMLRAVLAHVHELDHGDAIDLSSGRSS